MLEVRQELGLRKSHKPAVAAARGPAAPVQFLAALLVLPAQRAFAMDVPIAQGRRETRVANQQETVPVLGAALTSVPPK